MRPIIIAIAAGTALLAAACGSSKKIASVPAPLQQEILEQRADSLFFAAQRSKMLGDYKTAITQYSDYIRLNKKNATVFYELSRLFTEVRNPNYALGFARRAASMDMPLSTQIRRRSSVSGKAATIESRRFWAMFLI